MKSRVLSLIALMIICQQSIAYPNCANIPSSEGSNVVDFKIWSWGLLYPNSFAVNLKASGECFYISQNFMKVSYKSPNLLGEVYNYGFSGWNGIDPNTCTLSSTESL